MLNLITLVGRLTREPEIYGKEDKKVVSFDLAFDQGNEESGFVSCKCFKQIADTTENWLSKGDKIAVSGRLSHRKFEKKDGTKSSTLEIIVNTIEFIDVLKVSGDEVNEPNVEELPFEPAPEVKVPEKAVAKPSRTRR